MPTWVFWVIFSTLIFICGYTLYNYFLPEDTGRKERKQKRQTQIPANPEIAVKEEKISKLEGQISSLKSELEKARADYTNLQNEIKITRKKESELKEELLKREQWVTKSDEQLNKVKEQSADFDKKVRDKEKELKEEFGKNIGLNRQLREAEESYKLLEKESKGKSDEILVLKAQIERYTKEIRERDGQIKEHVETIAGMKKAQEGNEWVSKRDFNRLNEEYSKVEKELEEKEERLKKLSEEIIKLKNQLAKEAKPAAQHDEVISTEKEQPVAEQPTEERKEKEIEPKPKPAP